MELHGFEMVRHGNSKESCLLESGIFTLLAFKIQICVNFKDARIPRVSNLKFLNPKTNNRIQTKNSFLIGLNPENPKQELTRNVPLCEWRQSRGGKKQLAGPWAVMQMTNERSEALK